MPNDKKMPLTVITYTDNSPTRIDRYLKTLYPSLPYSVVQKWFRTGSIRVNDKRVKADYRLQAQDNVKIPAFSIPDQPSTSSPSFKRFIPEALVKEMHTWLIYEDEEILAFNKPAGIAVQGGTDIITSLDDLARHVFNNSSIRVVHRLDKETSGVLVMAKSRASAQKLCQAFHQQTVKKTYVAWVVGSPSPAKGRIENYLAKRRDDFEKITVVSLQENQIGDWAVTDYETIGKHPEANLTLLRLYPQTGRMHQLRVHMAFIATPILGDGKYGGKKAHPFPRRTPLGLHAESILFPWGLELAVPYPSWFQEL